MNKISFPLEYGMHGENVLDLQDALLLFIDKGVFPSNDGQRNSAKKALDAERRESKFGDMTANLIGLFQTQNQLEPTSSEVNEATANLINALLEEFGALSHVEQNQQRLVCGQAKRDDNQSFKEGLVRAFHHDIERGPIRLGEAITDSEGYYTIRYDMLPEVTSIFLRTSIMGQEDRLLQSFDIPNARPLETVNFTIPLIEISPKLNQHHVEGRIMMENGLPAEKIKLRLYRHYFGESNPGEPKIEQAGETITHDQGLYKLSYDVDDKSSSLEVRAVSTSVQEIPLTKIMHDLGKEERVTLNLIVPTELQPQIAEHYRLWNELKLYLEVGDRDPRQELAKARESNDRQDLSVLSRATGWDARLIALAANAAKLSADPEVGLAHEALYGLFRIGLPFDKMQLAQVNMEVVEQALTKAKEVGIIGLTEEELKQAKTQFEAFARKAYFSMPVPGSHSSYEELLKASSLSDDSQTKFATIYFDHQGNDDQLWTKAAEAGLTPDDIQVLQRQNKLAYFTLNNATMISRLQKDIRIKEPLELVEKDFYRPNKWEAELWEMAGSAANIYLEKWDQIKVFFKEIWQDLTPQDLNKMKKSLQEALDFLQERYEEPPELAFEKILPFIKKFQEEKLQMYIPFIYGGETVKDRLRAYIEDMARKVCLSYPTHVVWRMIDQDIDDNFKLGEVIRPLAATLLKNMADSGFELGQTPVEAFFKDHPEGLNNIDPTKIGTVKESIKTFQRVYQITPSNEAMTALLKQGFTSAYDVVSISQDNFLNCYGHLFPSLEQAKLVYRKAEQVNMVACNFLTLAKQLDTQIPMNAISASSEEREEAKKKLIKQFPSMETLFGSLDFCECEHCRSVLSPAAYFVDLLQFLEAFNLNVWQSRHIGQEYTAKYKKPYEALIERRPDLPHIQLTCENTQTAMPYIDMVNEVLEYYVANLKFQAETVYDTGEATTPELLAEPQNILPAAYDALLSARYPLTLPFDLWLETVRRFTDYFEMPLWRILETFRPGEELFDQTQTYDRAAIFAEQLRLTPIEYAIFTDPKPLDKWYELYGYITSEEATKPATDSDTGQRIDLNSAKTLSRRLGVTYKELVEIVRTGFVNPNLEILVILNKLKVKINDALFYKNNKHFMDQNSDTLSPDDRKKLEEVKAFKQRLDDLSKIFQMSESNAENWLNTALQSKAFDDVLMFVDPDSGCNFDKTTLCYAGSKPADDIAFLKLNLFVRLWRKLGWTIEETDRALSAFIPKNTPFTKDNLGKQPLKTALLYLAHFQKLDEQVHAGKQSRLKLITLWSQIATTGQNPLYAQLFLTKGVLKSDAVFDDPLGEYLSEASVTAIAQSRKHEVSLKIEPEKKIDPILFASYPKITLSYDSLRQVQHFTYQGILTDLDKDQLRGLLPTSLEWLTLMTDVQEKAAEFKLIKGHILALQGALGLTSNEIECILADVGKSIDKTELSLLNVSLFYRYGMFAKALKLSIKQLITLKQLSHLDPFKPLSDNLVTTLEDDYPFTQTLAFIEIVEQIKESGLNIEDLDYLLRHHFDPLGKYRPNRETELAFLKTIAEGVHAICKEHALPDVPGAMEEDVLRQKLVLILPPDVVEHFLTMMNRSDQFTVTKAGVKLEDKLDPKDYVGEPSIYQISYNEKFKEQKLTFLGVLLDSEKTRLNEKFPSPVFAALLQAVQEQAKIQNDKDMMFFSKYLEESAQNIQPTRGFLNAVQFIKLITPAPADLKEEQQQEKLREKRGLVVGTFLPFLQQRLIRQFIIQTIATQLNADSALIETLLTKLTVDQAPGAPQSLLEVFAATGKRGFNATFFASPDELSKEKELGKSFFTTPDTALKDKDKKSLKPEGTKAARFEGYLEVPVSGTYRFFVLFDKKDIKAKLNFDHLTEPLLEYVAVKEGDEISKELELKPCTLYRFTLELTNLDGSDARLLVQSEALSKGDLMQLTLYPQTVIDRAENAYLLLSKNLQLLQSLNLNKREISYFLTYPEKFDNLNLSKLPVQESKNTEEAKKLFAQFLRLAGYARLKRDLAGGADDLITIFESKELNKVYPLLAKLTRREDTMIRETIDSLFPSQNSIGDKSWQPFTNELDLQRLWVALQVIERFGLPVTTLTNVNKIISKEIMPGQHFAIARDLKEALKAHFEPETWQRIAQPIFDKLRQRQRDALVAYVMHQQKFARMEELYEYFLIDPGMEPVVQTSRIRLAIASVQLFIQRCLLNLEQDVPPTAINSKQWEWMKRYRVWEANRKIFLFPENWLEPEFRDDKTHLFSELEGNLLKGDVSNDSVEEAFFTYLKKLEELAQLEMVGMYCEGKTDPSPDTLHVIGRTHSEPHKYFYRRYDQQSWTPWDPITVEIQGDHLAPVVWRNRLYLFWVTFMDKPKEEASDTKASQNPAEKNISDLKMSEVISQTMARTGTKTVEVQLHWSEYFQGKWSAPKAGGLSLPLLRLSALGSRSLPTVLHDFDPKSIPIYVSKEGYEYEEERGVMIHVGLSVRKGYQVFYLAGPNSRLEQGNFQPPPLMPYSNSDILANRYVGNDALKVSLKQRIFSGDVMKPKVQTIPRSILEKGGKYTLLLCNNVIGLTETTLLTLPFFYQDNRGYTFFIKPSLIDKTVKERKGWMGEKPIRIISDSWKDYDIIDSIIPKIPPPRPLDPGDPIWRLPIDPNANFKVKSKQDWLANSSTVVQFDGELIGPVGRVELQVMPVAEAVNTLATGGMSININPGSAVALDSVVIAMKGNALEQAGLTLLSSGLKVVGSSGLNAELIKSFHKFT